MIVQLYMVAWIHAVNTNKLEKQLTKLDRLALLGVAQTAPSVPTRGLNVIYDVMPLKLFLVYTALKAHRRFGLELVGWEGRGRGKRNAESHRLWLDKKSVEWDLGLDDDDGMNANVMTRMFGVNTDSFNGASKHRRPAQYNVLTDGSKTRDGVGAGVAIYKGAVPLDDRRIALPPYGTVFQAELVAICEGAKRMTELLEGSSAYIKILCNSQAAISAVNSRTVRSCVVMRAIAALNELGRTATVRLVWIKAHAGHAGNEQADNLAKMGASGDGQERDTPKARQQVMAHILERGRAKWQDEWQAYPHARQTKQFLNKLNAKFSAELMKENRKTVTRLISAITGHGPFAYHQSLVCPELSPGCRFCEEGPVETFFHFINDCPCFAESRAAITGGYEIDRSYEWTVGQIKSFVLCDKIKGVFELVEGDIQLQRGSDIASDVLDTSDSSDASP